MCFQASSQGSSAPQATDRLSAATVVVQGLILDPSGAVIPHCPIEFVTGVQRKTFSLLSSADGSFQARLPAGRAEVSVDCDGFDPQLRVITAAGTAQVLRFHLKIAVVSATVDVGQPSAQADLDQSATQEAETLSAESIAVLPVLDQDYVSFMSRFLDPSATGVQGATLVVNGVEGGNFYQAPSAIKQLQVNQDQYSPAYATAGRARLSLVTSSGTKALHGSFLFALREHTWDATPDFSPVKPPEDREDYQGTLTGPLKGTKRWQYAFSGQLKKDEQYAVINAETTTGPDAAPYPTPYYRDKVSGALFFDDGAGHQFTAALGRTDEVHHNYAVGGLNLPSTAADSEYNGHFVDLQSTTLLSAHTLNQARFAMGQEGVNLEDDTAGPQIQVAGAFTDGSDQADHSYKQWTLSGNDLFAYSRKADTLRFGLDIPELSVHTDNDRTNREGTYYYPSLSAYQSGQPNLFTITAGQGSVQFASLSAALFVEDTHTFGRHVSLVSGARYYFQNVYHNRPTHIAPRAEAAIGLGKNSHTVLRLGAGIFYDRLLTTNYASLLQFNGARLNRYVLNDPPSQLATLANVPPSLTAVPPNATLPYLAQWSGALEQQLTKRVSVSAQGTMNAGLHLLRMRDVNAPMPPSFESVPNPDLGQVLASESEGHGHSDALDVFLKVGATHGFTQQLRYRLSRALNDTDGFSYVPANSYAPEQDAGWASYDQRQSLSLLSAWPLPFKVKLGTVLSAGTGLPYTELLGIDANRDGTPNDRPSGIGRNTLRGAAQFTLDTRLGRDFRLGPHQDSPTFSFSLSAFNITNHANYTSYEGVVTSPSFGQPITAAAPRQLQMNAVLSF